MAQERARARHVPRAPSIGGRGLDSGPGRGHLRTAGAASPALGRGVARRGRTMLWRDGYQRARGSRIGQAVREAWRRLRPKLLRALVHINRTVPPGLRSVLGVLLLAGGLLGFLPVLGVWMLPLGIWVIGLDVRAASRGLAARRARRGPRA